MSLNIDTNKLEQLKSDINNILNNTSSTFDDINNIISSISSDWSTESSEVFVNKINTLANTFDNYSTSLKNIINYLSDTEDQYYDIQQKAQATITQEG